MTPHDIIMKIIAKKVTCDKTLQLIRKSLCLGFIDPDTKRLVKTMIGTPQGSVLSPLLANIVLNELDQAMEITKSKFEKGGKRARNKEYDPLQSKIQYLQKRHPGSPEKRLLAAALKRRTPSGMVSYPNFKRMMYLRYHDDFVVILISGSKDDAHMIRNRVSDYLEKKCGLTLNLDKTRITNTKEGFEFLGASCKKPVTSSIAGLFKKGNPGRYRMRMRIMIPMNKLIRRLVTNGFAKMDSNNLPVPTARKDLVNFEHHEIGTFYNHRINGLVNFYSFAHNLNSLRKIIMFLQFSCALTLALKFKLRTKRQVFKKFGYLLGDPETGLHLKIPRISR